MDVTLGDSNIAISPGYELLVGININAANSINQANNSGEIDFEIIINIDVEQIL